VEVAWGAASDVVWRFTVRCLIIGRGLRLESIGMGMREYFIKSVALGAMGVVASIWLVILIAGIVVKNIILNKL